MNFSMLQIINFQEGGQVNVIRLQVLLGESRGAIGFVVGKTTTKLQKLDFPEDYQSCFEVQIAEKDQDL